MTLFYIFILSMNELSHMHRLSEHQQSSETHDFILRNISASISSKPGVSLNFHNSTDASLGIPCSLPVFNDDGRFDTPAFITNSQKAFKFAQREKNTSFKLKLDDSLSEKSELLMPKPTFKFCAICREPFEDYKQHVSHPVHKKKLSDSKVNFYISDLVQRLNGWKRSSPSQNQEEKVQQNKFIKPITKKRIVQDQNSKRFVYNICKDVSSSCCSANYEQHKQTMIRKAQI